MSLYYAIVNNKSLQRYMEEIVRSSNTPANANKIINEEKERQDEAKRRRAVEQSYLANNLSLYDVPLETVMEILRSASSLDEVATRIEPLTSREPGELLAEWREFPELWGIEVNDLRAALGLPLLEFLATEKMSSKSRDVHTSRIQHVRGTPS